MQEFKLIFNKNYYT